MEHGQVTPQIAQGLKELRRRIEKAGIPSSKLDETLNIATWNIREFGKVPRKEASLHYIAEVLGQFDLIALVELRDNLSDLQKVMQYMGPYWRVVYSDYDTDAAGNRERVAYLYDKRAVVPTGLAAEASPRRRKSGNEYLPEFTWWRSPYMASFRAGDFDFTLVTAHIRWGKDETDRLTELKAFNEWLVRRAKEPHVEDQDFIVLGDFNVPSTKSPLYKALVGKDLRMPAKLAELKGTNLSQTAHYDQILHFPKYTSSKVFPDIGGVVDFYAGDWKPLFPAKDYPDLKGDDCTYQMSDHLPLWMQIGTDVDDERLDQILERSPGRVPLRVEVRGRGG